MNGPGGTIREVLARFGAYAVLGYSGAGTVIGCHPSVLDLRLGDRVSYGGEGTGHGEAVLVARHLAARVPDTVPLDHACFATLGSIAMNAVRTAGAGIGDVVAVLGLGLVGQIVAQLARLQGAVVVGIDLKQDRMDLARRLGADSTAAGSAIQGTLSALTDGRGADVVVVAAAAKTAGPIRQALEICRDRGRIVVVGAVPIELPWQEMYLKEIQLFMSRAYGPGSYDPSYEVQGRDYPVAYVRWTEHRNMEEFLRLCSAGRVQIEPLISHRFALSDAPAAYETIMSPDTASLAVLLRYPAASPEGTASGPEVPGAPAQRVDLAPAAGAGVAVALVAASNIAKWAHLPNLKRAGGHLRAVVSSSGARGRGYAERFGAAYCCSDYQEVLADPAIAAVIITSRNQHHAHEAAAALRAGKHVFVEKPMALTEAECRDVEAAARESGRTLFVGFNRRFAPVYVRLKEAIRQRGGPAVLHCRVNSPGIAGSFWMADPSIGGAILGEACHFVDLMYWLLESEPVAVTAWTLPSSMKDPVGENNLAASFRFADGSIGNLTYCTVGSKTSAGERVEVFASGVGAFAEDFRTISIGRGTRTRRTLWFPKKGYDAQMQSFLSAVRSAAPAAVSVRDGSRATIGCLAMLRSAREQQPCAIDLQAALAAGS